MIVLISLVALVTAFWMALYPPAWQSWLLEPFRRWVGLDDSRGPRL